MTSRGLIAVYVEHVARHLVLISMISLTRVISQEQTAQSSTLCDDARQTIACPLPCYCRAPDHRAVRCDDGGLTSVPASVWSVAPVSLNFSFNAIAEWTGVGVSTTDNDHHVACLATLILSHSGVGRIRPRSFERLRGLRRLMLDHNDIATLDEASFVGLRQLQLLDVSHNELVALPHSLFYDLAQLKVSRP